MFNPMERIRKLSGMPAMTKGYPPLSHRKCSDWASYADAVDTVTRELVDQLMSCQASGLKIATSKAVLAGEKADLIEKIKDLDKTRGLLAADRALLAGDSSVDMRHQVAEAFAGKS